MKNNTGSLVVFLFLSFFLAPHLAQALSLMPPFLTDLTIGSSGEDVSNLQGVLVSKGFLVMPVGVSPGYFGPMTKAAVIKFQSANKILPTSGYVGPITRSVLNAGIPVPMGQAFVNVLSPNGGEVWRADEQQTIRWSAIPSNEPVSIVLRTSINECRPQPGLACPAFTPPSFQIVENTEGDGVYKWTPSTLLRDHPLLFGDEDSDGERFYVSVCTEKVCDHSDEMITIRNSD